MRLIITMQLVATKQEVSYKHSGPAGTLKPHLDKRRELEEEVSKEEKLYLAALS